MKKSTNWWPLILLMCLVIMLPLTIAINNLGFFMVCDGVSLTLHKVFDATTDDLKAGFNQLIDSNTDVLEDCTVVGYVKSPRSGIHEWLLDYGMEKYDVYYVCDILSFKTEIYRMGNSYYFLTYGMGACDKKNVYFEETSEAYGGYFLFTTSYLFEENVINANLGKNHDFCVALEVKKWGGDVDECN